MVVARMKAIATLSNDTQASAAEIMKQATSVLATSPALVGSKLKTVEPENYFADYRTTVERLSALDTQTSTAMAALLKDLPSDSKLAKGLITAKETISATTKTWNTVKTQCDAKITEKLTEEQTARAQVAVATKDSNLDELRGKARVAAHQGSDISKTVASLSQSYGFAIATALDAWTTQVNDTKKDAALLAADLKVAVPSMNQELLGALKVLCK